MLFEEFKAYEGLLVTLALVSTAAAGVNWAAWVHTPHTKDTLSKVAGYCNYSLVALAGICLLTVVIVRYVIYRRALAQAGASTTTPSNSTPAATTAITTKETADTVETGGSPSPGTRADSEDGL